MCNALIFGNVAILIQSFDSIGTRYRERMETINEFVRFHELPEVRRRRGRCCCPSAAHHHRKAGFYAAAQQESALLCCSLVASDTSPATAAAAAAAAGGRRAAAAATTRPWPSASGRTSSTCGTCTMG